MRPLPIPSRPTRWKIVVYTPTLIAADASFLSTHSVPVTAASIFIIPCHLSGKPYASSSSTLKHTAGWFHCQIKPSQPPNPAKAPRLLHVAETTFQILQLNIYILAGAVKGNKVALGDLYIGRAILV